MCHLHQLKRTLSWNHGGKAPKKGIFSKVSISLEILENVEILESAQNVENKGASE